jgi:hypothetical protein
MFISRFMIQILHNILKVHEGKRHQIKSFQICVVTNLSAPIAAFVFVPSALGRSFQQLNFEWYRQNFLLGNRKKIAKFLMGLLLAALPSSMDRRQ